MSASPIVETTQVELAPYNTFGLPGKAACFCTIADEADFDALRALPDWSSRPRLVLGGGSNIVLGGDYPGRVLWMRLMGRRLVDEDAQHWIVEAGAGESWHDFVSWTLAQGWPGLENLSLIPGTVGAAPIQNIGAYGLEMAERFHSLDALELDTGVRRSLTLQDCAFGYRDSRFKREAGRWAVLRVRFALPRVWQPRLDYADLAARVGSDPTPQAVADAVIAIRRAKLPDPAVLGNAGSFFKNPLVDAATHARLAAEHPQMPAYPQPGGQFKLASGWLIEQTGWKGRDLGPVGCFEKQALVLVNRGGARGEDVRRLAAAIQDAVSARFGVALEPEPLFV